MINKNGFTITTREGISTEYGIHGGAHISGTFRVRIEQKTIRRGIVRRRAVGATLIVFDVLAGLEDHFLILGTAAGAHADDHGTFDDGNIVRFGIRVDRYDRQLLLIVSFSVVGRTGQRSNVAGRIGQVTVARVGGRHESLRVAVRAVLARH